MTSDLAVDAGPTPLRVDMRGITQSFGAAKVLDTVDLRVQRGEIRALVGQNGAGKSTLMKILGGIYPEHQGTIAIDGIRVNINSPREAQRHGIALIHQELSLIPRMTVAENIVLGLEPGHFVYSPAKAIRVAQEVVARVPILAELPLDATVGDLNAGMQQRVEIAKVLARDVTVLVMDEPTARLSGPERDALRTLSVQLVAQGISIIYISHFLEEVFQNCDTVTILRNGVVVADGDVADFDMSSLTRSMLNTELIEEEFSAPPSQRDRPPRGPLLELANITSGRIHDVSLEVDAGEIVGLAGLVGSGRTRVARTIVGAERTLSGTIRIAGKTVAIKSPRKALSMGVVLIPEDRKRQGIINYLSAAFNMMIMALDRGMTRWGLLRFFMMRSAIRQHYTNLDITPRNPDFPADRLSGGNQQKVLLARVLLARPTLLIADQPTAGVDVGTKAQIHRLLRETAAEDTSILVVSDDLDELLALCDRIYVMHRGRVVAQYTRAELDRNKLVTTIAGESMN